MEVEKRIAKAKTALILEHPFVGSVALNMPMKIDNNVPTAATDGKRVLFNEDFCKELDDEELKFLVAHECMHPMLEHNFRRGERDRYKWNQAADYVINKLLTDEGIGKMPPQGLLSEDIYKSGGGTSDGIYNNLPDTPEDQQGNGGQGQPLDSCEDGQGSPAEVAQQQAEWKVKVAQAAQSAKMMGKLSAGLERLVAEILTPKVDWRDVLQRFVVKCRSDQRSWARPNRRFLSQGLYLPSVSGETLGEIAFAVDCSGSIGQDEINQFASEITTVWQDQRPTKVHVIYFDSEVSHYDEFDRDNEPVIKPHGGGGTAFSPVFRYMEEHGINPVACIFLTDLCCDDFGDEPDYPVLWVSTHSDKAPFGEVVMMENNNG
jgi:predicted metal-dependent peptidase